MNARILSCLFFSGTLLSAGAQTSPLPPIKRSVYQSDNKKLSKLDSAVEKIVQPYILNSQNCGVSIGIIKDGVEYFYNYGELKKNSGTIPDRTTMYEIGSMSKVFCGALLARAVLDKKVRADDDIRKYLPKGKYPNLEKNDQPVTLVHLANHSSGLPRIPGDLMSSPGFDSLNPYKHYDRERVFNYMKDVQLASEPGKVCEYSNLGMALLGIILEGVYKDKFENLVKEKICRPMNMPNTCMTLNEKQKEKFTKTYRGDGGETPCWEMGDLCAAGGLRSCTGDMLQFIKKNLGEEDPALKLSHTPTFTGGKTVGMAWHIMKTGKSFPMIWHNGATFGSCSFMGFIKEKNCGIVILSNSGNMVDFMALSLMRYLQK